MPTFHFFTLLTRLDQYDRMRESICAAGFDEENSAFTTLDNRAGNAHDPYRAIGEAVQTAQAPYVVFCHQDLLFDQGHGYDDLVRVLAELERRDPSWAVVGNAGLNSRFEHIRALTDHAGEHLSGEKPGRVLSLDENFLVIKRASGLACSEGLSGFHIYATDLCLNAYRAGHSAYVVDFRVTHLGTSLDDAELTRLATDFERFWAPALGGACIQSPAFIYLFVRNRRLDRLLRTGGRPRGYRHRPELLRLYDRILLPWRASWLPRV